MLGPITLRLLVQRWTRSGPSIGYAGRTAGIGSSYHSRGGEPLVVLGVYSTVDGPFSSTLNLRTFPISDLLTRLLVSNTPSGFPPLAFFLKLRPSYSQPVRRMDRSSPRRN